MKRISFTPLSTLNFFFVLHSMSFGVAKKNLREGRTTPNVDCMYYDRCFVQSNAKNQATILSGITVPACLNVLTDSLQSLE